MKQQAVDKLKKEMEGKTDGYTQVVGKFLLGHLEANEVFAEHVLKESKTIAGSLKAMKEVARKRATGGVGVLTDTEGFEIVVRYFEEAEKPKEAPKPEPVVEESVEEPAQPPVEDEDDVDLDDLL